MKKKTEQPLILYKKYLHDNQFAKEQPDEIVPVRRHRSLYQVVANLTLSVIVTILIGRLLGRLHLLLRLCGSSLKIRSGQNGIGRISESRRRLDGSKRT